MSWFVMPFLISLSALALVRSRKIYAVGVQARTSSQRTLVKIFAHRGGLVEPEARVTCAVVGSQSVDAVSVIPTDGRLLFLFLFSADHALILVEAGAVSELVSVGALAAVVTDGVEAGSLETARVAAVRALVHVDAGPAPNLKPKFQLWQRKAPLFYLNMNPLKQRQL